MQRQLARERGPQLQQRPLRVRPLRWQLARREGLPLLKLLPPARLLLLLLQRPQVPRRLVL